jgi:internalin A
MNLPSICSSRRWLQRINSLTLIALACWSAPRLAAQPVTFPDPVLEAAVRQTLDIPVAPITVPDMLTLTNLDAGWRGITNLSGLQTARNLRTLHVSGNRLTDLSPLPGLTNLLTLQASWNWLLDASPVAGLTNLVVLDLGANRDPVDWNLALNNTAWVSNFHQLRNLNLFYIGASNLAPVAGLTGLTNLDVGFLYQAANSAMLAGLTNLQRLSVAANGITDCGFLAPLGRLQEVDISHNAMVDISPLAGRDLLALYVSFCHTTNAYLATNFPNLRRLHLGGNDLTDASMLTNLVQLEELNLDWNNLPDFEPLTALTALTHLNVAQNPAGNWPVLASLPQLGALEIGGLDIYDLSPITAFNLWRLSANDNHISDTSPLLSQSGLGDLQLYNNQLVNVDPLTGLNGLWHLDVRENILDIYDPLSPAMLAIQQIQTHAGVDYLPQNRTPSIVISANPQDLCLNSGATAVFTVSASTDSGFLGYQWQFNGVVLPGEESETLTLTDITTAEAGRYRCLLFDDLGLSCSEEAVLAVDDPGCGSPIAITLQPRSQCAAPGDWVWFEVSATTQNSSLFYQWQFGGVDIPDATDASLELAGVGLGDAGVYRVRVEDDIGAVKFSLPAELMVVEEVTFPDPELDALVRQELGLSPGDPITLGELDNLYQLDASFSGLTSLAGLECARSLSWLALNGNLGITNFSVLSRIYSLHELYLNECGLTSVGFLAPMTDLQRLELNDNHVADAAPLAGLTNLYWLQMNWNGCMAHLEALAGLQGLNVLGIAGSCADSLSIITGMPYLSWLNARDNAITDLSPLGGREQLVELELSWNSVSDFALLAGLTNLYSLHVSGNGATNADFVLPLWRLTSLSLDNNPVPSLLPVVGKTNLTYLAVNDVATTNMSPLAGLTNMGILYLGGNHLANFDVVTNMPLLWALGAWNGQLTSLAPLAVLPRLGYLNLDDNDVTNAAALTGMTNLQWVYLRNNALKDLSPLAGATNLRSLNLEGNRVSDLTALNGKGLLDWLILAHNQITSLTPLAGCSNLVTLSLENNLITSLAPLSNLPRLNWLQVRSNQVAALPSLAGLPALATLDAGFNRISNVAAVTSAPGLRWCRLEFNELADFDSLTNLVELDYLDVRRNYLSTNSGSPDMVAVAQMQSQGTFVDYLPQRDAAANPVLSNPTWLPGNQFRFTLTSAPGAVVEVLRAGAVGGPWTSAGCLTNGSGTTNFTDTAPPLESRFYRARVP